MLARSRCGQDPRVRKLRSLSCKRGCIALQPKTFCFTCENSILCEIKFSAWTEKHGDAAHAAQGQGIRALGSKGLRILVLAAATGGWGRARQADSCLSRCPQATAEEDQGRSQEKSQQQGGNTVSAPIHPNPDPGLRGTVAAGKGLSRAHSHQL